MDKATCHTLARTQGKCVLQLLSEDAAVLAGMFISSRSCSESSYALASAHRRDPFPRLYGGLLMSDSFMLKLLLIISTSGVCHLRRCNSSALIPDKPRFAARSHVLNFPVAVMLLVS